MIYINPMRSMLLGFLLCLMLCSSPFLYGAPENASRGAASLEERQAMEKKSRSRYRDLEVASLVLIVVVGGAAILWAVRRR